MKKLFFIAIIVAIPVGVCGWWFSTHILQDVARRQQDAQSLVAPPRATVAPGVTNDEDAGSDDVSVEVPRWEIGFGAAADAWTEVMTAQRDGMDIHVFSRAGSDMILRVAVMDVTTDVPPTEIVGRTRDRFERIDGVHVSPIETFTTVGRPWIGFRFGGVVDGVAGTGMTFAAVDAATGAKIEIFAVWPEADDEACAAAFLAVLRGITIRRSE